MDPWGHILAECPKYNEESPTNESVAVAEVSRKLLAKIRMEMPVFEHRRNDIYNLYEVPTKNLTDTISSDHLMFSDKIVPKTTIFYVTKYSFGFTNIRCVVPGRILSFFICLSCLA